MPNSIAKSKASSPDGMQRNPGHSLPPNILPDRRTRQTARDLKPTLGQPLDGNCVAQGTRHQNK